MNISKTDSTNFRATMNISQMKNYKHYWQEVANNFAKRTADTEATMAILNPSGFVGFGITFHNKKQDKESLVYVSCTKDSFEKMTNESPSDTADKLTKMFTVAAEADKKRQNIISKFKEEIKKLDIKANDFDKFDSLYKQNVNTKKDKVMKTINKNMDNSTDLKGFEIFI